MKLIYYIFLALTALTGACESDAVNVKLPEFEKKLVVAAFLSPSDTVSYFHISTSNPVFNYVTNSEPVGKITAFISNGSKEVILDSSEYGDRPVPSEFMLDRAKMEIEYGKSYNLRVSTANGYFAEAKCTVPEKRSFNIRIDTVTLPGKGLRAKASFNDIPEEENYYRIKAWVRSYSHSVQGARSDIYTLHPEKKFFTDAGIDGKNIVIFTDDYLGYMGNKTDSSFIVFRLFNTEKSYYLYHHSLDNYEGGDNPFVEPTPVYSNITGGLGIFSSYAIDSAVFRLK